MGLQNHAVIWPKIKEFFPEHFTNNTMPTKAEVVAKVNELYAAGSAMDASRLSIWKGSVQQSSFSPEPDIQLEPRVVPEQEPRVEEAFRILSEIPTQDEPEQVGTGIRFKDFIIPLVVIILVIVFMISSVVLTEVTRVTPSGDGTERLDRFPDTPALIAPPAFAPPQEIAEVSSAPKSSSEYFRSIDNYRISERLELAPAPTEAVAELWRRTIAIFGEDAKHLKTLGIAREEYSAIAGYLSVGSGELVINLNRAMENKEVQEYTLVHEYNHLVTLKDQELSFRSSCETTLLVNGGICLSADSSLQHWIEEFWSDTGMLTNTETGNVDAGRELYSSRPQDFVSVYAASAPQEDMAESFAAWVFDYEMPAAKEKFFEADAESVALKQRITSSLALLA